MRSFVLLIPLVLLPACGGSPSEAQSSSQGSQGETVQPGASSPAGAVSGQVLVRGAPSHAVVMIKDQIVTTNAEGQFTLPNVDAIYDVTVALPTGAIVYQGMTGRSPIFNVSPQSGTDAALVPVALPAAPDATHGVTVFATSSDPSVAPFAFGVGPGATSTLAVGPLGSSVTLHALAFDADPTTQAPAAWTGHAELTLANLQWTEPTWSVAFAPLTSTSLAVHPSVADGFALGSASLFLHGSADPVASIPAGSADGDLGFVTADLAGLTFDVLILASSATGGGGATAIALAPDAAHATVSFPGAPASLAPADGAVVAPGSAFAFTPVPGVAHWVTFAPTAASDYPIQVVTMGSSVTLPDLGALGHPLRAGESFGWWVEYNGAPATVDAAAAAGLVVNGGVGQRNAVSAYGESGERQVSIAAANGG